MTELAIRILATNTLADSLIASKIIIIGIYQSDFV